MNKFEIIDFFRRTNITEQYDHYVNVFQGSINTKRLLSIRDENLVKFLNNLKLNKFFSRYLKQYSEKDIEFAPYEILSSLPVTDKSVINKNFNQIHNSKYPTEKNYTGGSTGAPFHYRIGKKMISRVRGFNYALWNHFVGYSLGDNVLVIAGSSLGGEHNIKESFYNFLQSKTFVSGGIINKLEARRLSSVINRHAIKFIYAYPSSLIQYLKIINSSNINTSFDKIQAVICTSEILTDQEKKYIENNLNVPVINVYGANDGGVIAGSLDNEAFYYNGCDCVVENKNSDGCSELLITSLHSFGFPFVRYQVGDLASIKTKSTGYPFVLENLVGRSRDFIHLSNTKKIHGAAVNKVMKKFPQIIQYQIEQYSLERCEIRIVLKNRSADRKIICPLQDKLNELLHPISVDVVAMNRIKKNSSGKHKIIISHV